jgi:hypothetical protein
MGKSRFRVVAALLVVFSLLFSACFQVRGFRVGPKDLAPGETAKIKLTFTPMGLDWAADHKVVVLVGLNRLDFRGISDFDIKGLWGGPFTVSNNTALRDHLLTPGVCTSFGIDVSDVTGMTWRAYATNDVVPATGLTAAELLIKARLNVQVDRSPGTPNGEAGHFLVLSGWWADAGNDGVYSAGEAAVCTGAVLASVSFVAS